MPQVKSFQGVSVVLLWASPLFWPGPLTTLPLEEPQA